MPVWLWPKNYIVENIPAFHVLLPPLADDYPVKVVIDHSWRINSICLDHFQRLGQEGSHCSRETCGKETNGSIIIYCYFMGHD